MNVGDKEKLSNVAVSKQLHTQCACHFFQSACNSVVCQQTLTEAKTSTVVDLDENILAD